MVSTDAYLSKAACTSLPGVGGGTLVPDVLPAAGGFLGGETVTITCDAGFSTDTSTSTCISSTSEWIPGQLICTAFNCNAAPTVTNGGSVTPTWTDGYPANTVVTAACATGFASTVGANTAECTAENTWTPVSLTCSAACTALPAVVQGTLSPNALPANGGFADAATVTVTCNAGHAIVTDTTTCTASSNTWSPATLTCSAACTALPGVVQGTLSPSTVPAGGFADADTVTVTCNGGFAIATATTTCTAASNTWSQATLTCTAACTALPGVVQGTLSPAVVPSGGFADTTTVTVTCNAGFSITTATSDCTGSSNTWTVPTLTCTAIECGALTITNGVGTSGTTAYNGVITVTCATNYIVSGTATLTCDGTESNNWSAAVPTCEPACTSLPNVVEGTLSPNAVPANGGFADGDTVTVTCNAGFAIATATSTCTATSNTWTPATLTCAAATCAAAATLTQGTFQTVPVGGYTGTQTITCNSGYELATGAASSSLCTATDTWDPTLLECTAITCSALTVANGAVAPTGTVAYNGEVTVTCDSGYTLSSTTATLKCDGTLSNNYNVATPTCDASSTTATTTSTTTAGSSTVFHFQTSLVVMVLSAFAFVASL